jgi:hypothetical protein
VDLAHLIKSGTSDACFCLALLAIKNSGYLASVAKVLKL